MSEATQYRSRAHGPGITSFVLAMAGLSLSVLVGAANLFIILFNDVGAPQPMALFANIWFVFSAGAGLSAGLAIFALVRRTTVTGLAIAALVLAVFGLLFTLACALWNMNAAAEAAASLCQRQPANTYCTGR